MADITIPGMFLSGDHASRPAANAVGGGALYACSDHALIYQSDGSAWSTWATLGSAGGGGFAQISRVKLTSGDLSTTSTTFVDATGLTVTLTTEASRCLVTFSGMGNVGSANTVRLDVAVDGTRQGGSYGLLGGGGSSEQNNLSFSFWTDVLTAGPHTIKLQWSVDGGTGTLYASAVAPAIFAVAESNLTT